MKSIWKIELKKAFQNKFFWLSILIGSLITILSFVPNLTDYYQNIEYLKPDTKNMRIVSDPRAFVFTVFNSWIGGEAFSLGTSIYFFIFPLLIALPYGWSYSEEKQNGYRRLMIVKVGKKGYYAAKYVAVFLSGGVAMVLPLIWNLWMVSLCIPAVVPDVTASMFYGVFGSSFLAGLYYTVPALYVALYILIDFIFCGFLACISLAVSGMIRQKWIVVIVPFLFLLFIHTATRFVYSNPVASYKEISPLYFLRGVEARYATSGIVILGFGLGIFVVTLLCMIKEYRDEIY